jgi:Flp pilus assembly pilin Flp
MVNAQSEYGQGFLEYALLLSLIFLIVIIVVALFGDALLELYNNTIGPLLDAFFS